MSHADILLIEDTPTLLEIYRSLLKASGHSVTTAVNAADGLQAFAQHSYSLVVLDIALPDQDGLELMNLLLSIRPKTAIIAITADRSVSLAVRAMRAGASELLVKPFDQARFLNAVNKALKSRNGAARNQTRISASASKDFIGTSLTIETAWTQIRSAAASRAPVFITGEIGTGKERCARTIHDLSVHRTSPFIKVNCRTISSDRHERDSLETALSPHQDDMTNPLVVQNRFASLYFDEICELSMDRQESLFERLQDMTPQFAGFGSQDGSGIRLMAASRHDPIQAIAAGKLSEQLYYALHVIPIWLPPLRERKDDLMIVAQDALQRFSQEEGRQFTGFDSEVAELFTSMHWPGNIRELLNVIRGIVVSHRGPTVTLAMLPAGLLSTSKLNRGTDNKSCIGADAIDALVGLKLAEIERRIIERTIAGADGSIAKAARILDVAPSTIYRKMEGWQAAEVASQSGPVK